VLAKTERVRKGVESGFFKEGGESLKEVMEEAGFLHVQSRSATPEPEDETPAPPNTPR
jgi:hypothetical protein